MTTAESRPSLDFLRSIIEEDFRTGRFSPPIVTRFPPEPNGFLHIGHAKSVCLNFALAREYGGRCHLRFDDTNPTKEEQRYIDAIKEDIRWLGFDWGNHEYHASDYFQQMYDWAVLLIRKGKAYVCDLPLEEVRRMRGTLTLPGENSPFRNRSAEENLDLFERMKNGEFENGSRTLRAKIDMTSPNLNMRDPVMYRILRASHPRTGDAWCIYPMYDFAHGQSDSIEEITHSICTLEFEDHRPLYDWFIKEIGIFHPRQVEFARLNLSYTVMSKRKLLELVKEGHVAGWDDPRMPTLAAMRRRGYPPAAIRAFCDHIGVARRPQVIDLSLLEHFVREDLNKTAPRVFGVLRPLKLVITNYPDDQVEELDAINNPEDESAGTRKVPFSKTLYIEREDFEETPPPKFFRLTPGKEVRLRAAYYVTCTGLQKDPSTGEITEVHCTYDPATRGGWSQDGRKIKGTIHWVSAQHAVDAEVRLYDRLFSTEDPDDVEEGRDWHANLNPNSLETLTNCKVEPSLAEKQPGDRVQFERQGYLCVDPESGPALRAGEGHGSESRATLIFNRTVALRDSWSKIKQGAQA